jgi:hypothetical protein
MGTLLVGIFIGFGMTLVVKTPEVQARNSLFLTENVPVNGKKEWEYKVVYFDGDVDKSEKKMNELASQRWEYVGLIRGDANSMVTFKRLK